LVFSSKEALVHGGRSRRLALAALLAAALTLAALLTSGTRARGASGDCTANTQQGVLCVSVVDTPDPVAYSSFDQNVTFLDYEIAVSNQSRSSSLSHVGITDTLPDGTTLVSATSSRGDCTTAGRTVTCPLGAFKNGQGATAEIVVTAPATALSDPPTITITNRVDASFDERFSDKPNGGKQDTATALETTTVSKTAGQTFVPEGHTGQVDTDPAKDQYANARIPSASTDVLATLHVLSADAFCDADGTVRIGNKNYICRQGGFVDASVVDADTEQRYSNTDDPLVFHLRWAPGLVSDRQTVRNFVIFYRAGATAALQVFDQACNASASNPPCIRNVVEGLDGSWSADLVKIDNGHMR
jgi:uncharacterized repeat protein (TIGR01451 family)